MAETFEPLGPSPDKALDRRDFRLKHQIDETKVGWARRARHLMERDIEATAANKAEQAVMKQRQEEERRKAAAAAAAAKAEELRLEQERRHKEALDNLDEKGRQRLAGRAFNSLATVKARQQQVAEARVTLDEYCKNLYEFQHKALLCHHLRQAERDLAAEEKAAASVLADCDYLGISPAAWDEPIEVEEPPPPEPIWPVAHNPYYHHLNAPTENEMRSVENQARWMKANVEDYNRNLLQTQRIDNLLRQMNVRNAFWTPPASVYLYDQAPGPRHASAAAASMHSHNPYMGGVQRVWGVQPQ